VRGPDYTYQDGRGQWLATTDAASNGALAIRPLKRDALEIIRISGDGDFWVWRPYHTRGRLAGCDAYDVESKQLPPPLTRDDGAQTRISPIPKAVRYVVRFGK